MNLHKATAKGLRVQTWTGKDMFDTLVAQGRDMKVWMSYGHVNGVEQFSIRHMHANVEANRVEVLLKNGNVLQAWTASANPEAWQAKTMRVLVR